MSNPSALIIANKQQLNGRKLFLKHSMPETFLKRVHAAKKANLIKSISWNTFRPNLKKNLKILAHWVQHF